jgi:hypothetical protein
LQVCGTAQYVDDIKLPAGALHAALVMSAKPHAKILGLDTAAAAAMPGVHGIYTGGYEWGWGCHYRWWALGTAMQLLLCMRGTFASGCVLQSSSA